MTFLDGENFIQGQDDVTGEPLSQREDDRAEVIRHRLETFDKNFYPIREFYRSVFTVKTFSLTNDFLSS